ncbi:hypothetical protein PTH_2205 [Pelotomaculum thermopropionicum SI]|uniref:Uncharacterized protein n=1 Tax=Pelotomaculum thermopropionicum (strain DSM 13744 / JCM 10971 / SI) TaxID=370438 RepID=A5D042_PELTS|nr:hypothetical protein PTH_2205 [Pelotomaculum thermopropionicum SI]
MAIYVRSLFVILFFCVIFNFILVDSYCQTMSQSNNDQSVSISALYEALLETKNDKIIILNNIITWGITIVAIVVTAISSIWYFLYKKVRDKTDELMDNIDKSNKLINDLYKAKRDIEQQQNKIDDILNTRNFKESFEEYKDLINNKLFELEDFVNQIKLKQLTVEKISEINSFKSYVRLLGHSEGPFPNRMSIEDIELYNDICKYKDKLDELTIEQIKSLNSKFKALYTKYRKEGDKFDYMV